MTNTVIFPSSSFDERAVDEEFEAEYGDLRFAGVERALVDQDRLMREHAASFRRLPQDGRALYRGWMLDEAGYRVFCEALTARGIQPVTSLPQYLAAHHLPGWVGIFETVTPKTTFVAPDASPETIREAGSRLGVEAFVVKDYVKSRKHEWVTACFAPSLKALPQIVDNFVALQAEFLVGQVAIREYVELDGSRPEYRVWWANGKPVALMLHPDAADATNGVGVSTQFLLELEPLVAQLDNPFITTDIATRADGTEIVIEVGDGQVSGLPRGYESAAYEAVISAVFAER